MEVVQHHFQSHSTSHVPEGQLSTKSSLVAAIANYMRSNVYDLQFQGVRNDYDLSRILTSTTNRSILLIEDIHCITTASHDRTNVIEKCEVEEDEDENKRSFPINNGIIHLFLSLSWFD
uniref:ATPase AAA-type core domain-containing protein n=1 Tax=Gossypium raimondii TaxID=29730 RepID=A0A0D2SGT8_GOSRA|nr:hypothetical protein B456_007G200100 [Gossypium raimondii]